MSEILNTSAVIFNVGWRALESDAKKQITAWFFNCFLRRKIYTRIISLLIFFDRVNTKVVLLYILYFMSKELS